MDVTEIPFGKLVGIKPSDHEEALLELPGAERYHNHLGTVHASAQFTLAESASGEFLARTFPELVGKVAPMVRGVNVKYRRPAKGRLFASASCDQDLVENLPIELEKRGVCKIFVSVVIEDENKKTTMKAKIEWVIYKLEG